MGSRPWTFLDQLSKWTLEKEMLLSYPAFRKLLQISIPFQSSQFTYCSCLECRNFISQAVRCQLGAAAFILHLEMFFLENFHPFSHLLSLTPEQLVTLDPKE